MKNKAIKKTTSSFLLLAALASTAVAQTITVSNPINLARPNEVVSVSLASIPGLNISNGGPAVRDGATQKKLVTQLIDNDQDGKADELLFLASFGPNERKEFTLGPDNGSGESGPEVTFSRFVPERQNDYAWENDRVAFRVYGSQNTSGRRQSGGGVDAFFKRVNYPILDKFYKANAEKEGAYHIDTGEGYDPYQVGSGRGIGGTGIWLNDSLHVPGNFLKSRTIAVGPLRTVFELDYGTWDVAGTKVTETKRVSLDLGSHLSKVTQRFQAEKALPNITAGISLHDKKGELKVNGKDGWYRYWEPMDDSWLGTAILAAPEKVISHKDHRPTARDQSHLLVVTRPDSNGSTFYTGYAWAKSGHFKTAAEWDKYLSEFSLRVAAPLKVVF